MGRRRVVSLVLFYKSIKTSQTKYIKKRRKGQENWSLQLGVCGQSDGWSLDPLRMGVRAWATEFDRLCMFRITQECPDSSLGRGFTLSDAALKMSRVVGGDGGASGVWDGLWILLVTWLRRGTPYQEGGHWHDRKSEPISTGTTCQSFPLAVVKQFA